MALIRIHQNSAGFQVARATPGRRAKETISCQSLEELEAILFLLGVAKRRSERIFRRLETATDAFVKV
jgi:hypothetical protein